MTSLVSNPGRYAPSIIYGDAYTVHTAVSLTVVNNVRMYPYPRLRLYTPHSEL